MPNFATSRHAMLSPPYSATRHITPLLPFIEMITLLPMDRRQPLRRRFHYRHCRHAVTPLRQCHQPVTPLCRQKILRLFQRSHAAALRRHEPPLAATPLATPAAAIAGQLERQPLPPPYRCRRRRHYAYFPLPPRQPSVISMPLAAIRFLRHAISLPTPRRRHWMPPRMPGISHGSTPLPPRHAAATPLLMPARHADATPRHAIVTLTPLPHTPLLPLLPLITLMAIICH